MLRGSRSRLWKGLILERISKTTSACTTSEQETNTISLQNRLQSATNLLILLPRKMEKFKKILMKFKSFCWWRSIRSRLGLTKVATSIPSEPSFSNYYSEKRHLFQFRSISPKISCIRAKLKQMCMKFHFSSKTILWATICAKLLLKCSIKTKKIDILQLQISAKTF